MEYTANGDQLFPADCEMHPIMIGPNAYGGRIVHESER